MNAFLQQRLEALQCIANHPALVADEQRVELVSWSNARGASRGAVKAKARRVRAQRQLGQRIGGLFRGPVTRLPARFFVVHLCRVSPRALDDDNLGGALKAVRDGIARAIGINDRSPLVRYVPSLQRGAPGEHLLRVELYVEPGDAPVSTPAASPKPKSKTTPPARPDFRALATPNVVRNR